MSTGLDEFSSVFEIRVYLIHLLQLLLWVYAVRTLLVLRYRRKFGHKAKWRTRVNNSLIYYRPYFLAQNLYLIIKLIFIIILRSFGGAIKCIFCSCLYKSGVGVNLLWKVYMKKYIKIFSNMDSFQCRPGKYYIVVVMSSVTCLTLATSAKKTLIQKWLETIRNVL